MPSHLRRFALRTFVALGLFFVCLPVAAQQQYTITDLGTGIGYTSYRATGINNAGQVVGYAYANSNTGAFLWEKDRMTYLGTLGGSYGMATGINNNGYIVGNSETGRTYLGYFIWHGFISKGQTQTDLTPPGFQVSAVSTINDAGQVVLVAWNYYDSNGGYFIWDSTHGARPFSTLYSGIDFPGKINNKGQMIGTKYDDPEWSPASSHIVLSDGVQGARDLGALEGSREWEVDQPTDLNEAAQVVGVSGSRAFIWDSQRGIRDLGTLGGETSRATAINESGQVVGRIWNPGASSYTGDRAFLWDEENGMRDLNSLIPADSGWHLVEATGINDAGQIVGYGYHDGKERAFLLEIPQQQEPLIFVPGIAGSHLIDRDPAFYQSSDLWPGFYSNHSRLTLDPRKQQADVAATDAIRTYSLFGGTVTEETYTPLLEMLTSGGKGGFTEYRVEDEPERLTEEGCDCNADRKQMQNDVAVTPTLFVFAYDWRRSNEENAQRLGEYIKCIQRFHPNKKVNILAHSMGGLLARRYILQQQQQQRDHHVKRLITINTPWLGAPKAINVLETGDFLPKLVFNPTLKALAEFFPGMHELLPSRLYYSTSLYYNHLPATIPFAEQGWDINGNGIAFENYNYDKQVSLLDMLHPHPQSLPGMRGKNFHDTPGQDDWQGDTSGVEYYSLISTQNRDSTIGEVRAMGRGTECFGDTAATGGLYLRCETTNEFATVMTAGDETVPLVSLERGWGYNLQLRGNSELHFFYSPGDSADERYNHTEATKLPEVHDRILYLLGLKPAPPGGIPQLYPEPYISDSSRGGSNFNDMSLAKASLNDGTTEARAATLLSMLGSAESSELNWQFGQHKQEVKYNVDPQMHIHRADLRGGSLRHLCPHARPEPGIITRGKYGAVSPSGIRDLGSNRGCRVRFDCSSCNNAFSPLTDELNAQLVQAGQEVAYGIDNQAHAIRSSLWKYIGRNHRVGFPDLSTSTLFDQVNVVRIGKRMGTYGFANVHILGGDGGSHTGIRWRTHSSLHPSLTNAVSKRLTQPKQEVAHDVDSQMRSHGVDLRSGLSSRFVPHNGATGVLSGWQSGVVDFSESTTQILLGNYDPRSHDRSRARATYRTDNQLQPPPTTEVNTRRTTSRQDATHDADSQIRAYGGALRSGNRRSHPNPHRPENSISEQEFRSMVPGFSPRRFSDVHNNWGGDRNSDRFGDRTSQVQPTLDYVQKPFSVSNAPSLLKASFARNTNKQPSRIVAPAVPHVSNNDSWSGSASLTMTQQTGAPAYGTPRPPTQPSYCVTVKGVGYVSITDAAGNTNEIIDDTFILKVPNVSYNLLGEKSVLISTPTSQTYTLSFQVGASPIMVEAIKGLNNVMPTEVVRYRDLALPAGVTVLLKITPDGVEQLRYDADGDGAFETLIPPTVSVSGDAAKDTTAPVVNISAGQEGASTVVTISAGDDASGVKRILYSFDGTMFRVYDKPFTLNPAQASIVYAFADDNVGNRSSLISKQIDAAPPTTIVTLSTPANAAGWNNSDVTLTFSATDNTGGSGIREITYSAAGAQPFTVMTTGGASASVAITAEGITTLTFYATDNAGNSEAAKTIEVKLDKTAPTIMVSSPVNTYLLNQAVVAKYSCNDGGSGIASCSGTTPNGDRIQTSSVGVKSFTVTAVDVAGNTAAATANYTVGYGISLKYDSTKAHKSGSTVPIKIQLVDARGANVSSQNIVVHGLGVAKASDYAASEVEDAGNANPDDNFRFTSFDGANGYIYNLKTTGLTTGTYLLLFKVGNDPTTHTAQFQVK